MSLHFLFSWEAGNELVSKMKKKKKKKKKKWGFLK